jgi:Family of unknown function (DUF6763)
MNTMAWPPRIGGWYLRWDKNEVFQVTAYDERTHRALLEPLQGDATEIDQATWDRLSLGLADPPEDWAGPVETVDVVDVGRTGSGPVSEDIAGPRGEED